MSYRYKKLKLDAEAELESGSSLPLVYVRFCGFISGNRRNSCDSFHIFSHQLPIGDEI